MKRKITSAVTFFLVFIAMALIVLEKRNSILQQKIRTLSNKNKTASEKYNRKKHFESWKDFDNNGLNTRYEVLFANAHKNLPHQKNYPKSTKKQRELLENNFWNDSYTQSIFFHTTNLTKTRSLSLLQIDHIVPVLEAWRSGACHWNQEKRLKFYNWRGNFKEFAPSLQGFSKDIRQKTVLKLSTQRISSGFPHGNLALTHAKQNQKKSHLGPKDWLPPNPSAVVRFLSTWITTKQYWNLSADAQEIASIETLLGKNSTTQLRRTEHKEEGCIF